MADPIYRASAPVFTHHLKNLSAQLKLARRDAKARGIPPDVLPNARLAPDMWPLTRQVQIATDHAKGCCSRLAGLEPPVLEDNETELAALEERIRKTLAVIRGIKAKDYRNAGARDIVFRTRVGELYFNGVDYLYGFALPNFFFHCTTAYNILRHNGVPLGKGDFLGRVPGMTMDAQAARRLGSMGKPAGKR